MTQTSETPAGSPAPGWYPDPAGSGGTRWWDGSTWTTSVQQPPVQQPPVPAVQVTVPDPVAGAPSHPAFGTMPAHPAFGAAPSYPVGGGRLATPAMAPPVPAAGGVSMRWVVAGVAALVLASVAVVLLNRGSGDSATSTPPVGSNGQRGPAQEAAMKSDLLLLANEEETAFADAQHYVAVPRTAGPVQVGGRPVRLSAGDQATIAVNGAGSAFCVTVVSTNAPAGTSSTMVYASAAGGYLPGATRCPAGF